MAANLQVRAAMVTAGAPLALNAPPVTTSPGSVPVSPGPAHPNNFREVYRESQRTDDDSNPKPKTPIDGGKKQSSDDDTKAAPVAVQDATSAAPKAPLLFSMPTLGLAGQDELVDAVSGGDDSAKGGGEAVAEGSFLLQGASAPVAGPKPATETPPGKLAFSIHLLDAAPAKTQPLEPARHAQTANTLSRPSARETKSPIPAAVGTNQPEPAEMLRRSAGPEAPQPTHELATLTSWESRPTESPFEATPLSRPGPSVAVQEIQAVQPEAPKAAANTEILLHLGGKDQSSASVRVMDRGGTVNVSVHAPDSDLRNSLRSNLGELAAQLSEQGFRTEVIRPTMVAARMENAPDHREDSRHSHYQHNAPTQDQPHSRRDRHTEADRWLEELEQETSGDAGTRGGTT